MSDSQPPYGSPDPDSGWDLEGLLSGKNVWLPEGMRPVPGTLAALRAAPMRTEWAGEAAARTAFRQIMLAGSREPARSGGGADDARTLILSARTADGGAHAVTRRHRSHRRPSRRRRRAPRRGGWRSTALAGAALGAAAAVIIGGIALAGVFSGAGGRTNQLGNSAAVTSTTTNSGGTGPGPGGLEGSAAKEVTAGAAYGAVGGQQSAGSGAESERSSDCSQYWAFFAHPESSASWAAEQGTLQRLSELAGSPWNVPEYCGAYYQWGFAPPPPAPAPGNNPGAPASRTPTDSPGKNPGSEPHSGTGNGNNGSGNQNNGNGSGDNGNGPSGKGSGSGSQGQH